MTAIASATVAMRAKLLMQVIWDSPLGSGLEPVAEVQADEVCVSAVRPVEVRFERAKPAVGAAFLEVKCKLGGIHDPVAAVPADAEARSLAIRIGQQRADVLDRLSRAVVEQTETDVPHRIDRAVRAEAI